MAITNTEMARQYGTMHKEEKYFPGQQALKYIDDIKSLMKNTHSKTILDYGSGKGKHAKKLKLETGADITCYDPYYEPLSVRPQGLFDGVICTDVMEHIPEKDVDDVLEDIFNHARNFVFLSISTREAKKVLPNGENAHCTVKSEDWWHQRIGKTRVETLVRFE